MAGSGAWRRQGRLNHDARGVAPPRLQAATTARTQVADHEDAVHVIVYHSTRQRFLEDVERSPIEDIIAKAFLERTGRYAPDAEYRAWRNSIMQMADVLADDDMPGSMGVGVELGIPQTAKRIDFVLSGTSGSGDPRVIIVELKQWSTSRVSDRDGLVIANRGGHADIEGIHPCYQAWSYAALLEGFNEAVHGGGIGLNPCAYLHNHHRDGIIDAARYAPYIDKAPLFLRGPSERRKLQDFIKQHVKDGDDAQALYRIEHGRIRPSKMLADSLSGMLRGNREFVLVDDQKVVYETCLAKAAMANPTRKQVVIVQGGPGTGKSVVAINLMVALTRQGLLAKYISKNAAPRAVYAQKLKGQRKQAEISMMFGSSGAFIDTEADLFDALIVDEAHRLNEKSGLYGNLGENQIKELIAAAKCTILFCDDDQMVTLADIGHSAEIDRWARHLGADVTHLALASQFRCRMSGHSQFDLLKQRRFLPYFTVQALGAFNDNVYRQAIIGLLGVMAAAAAGRDHALYLHAAGAGGVHPAVLPVFLDRRPVRREAGEVEADPHHHRDGDRDHVAGGGGLPAAGHAGAAGRAVRHRRAVHAVRAGEVFDPAVGAEAGGTDRRQWPGRDGHQHRDPARHDLFGGLIFTVAGEHGRRPRRSR
jgi:hypothetical protein